MKFFFQIFKKQAKECVLPAAPCGFSVRRNDAPAHPPVFSPFCRKWEREQAAAGEEGKTAVWDELSRILSFADRREKGDRQEPVRPVRGEHNRVRRPACAAEEELFPELSALRGFNMEERGMLQRRRSGGASI